MYEVCRDRVYTPAECSGRHSFKINGKEYSECSFCPTSCPARDLFKEPDSGLPLKCDMCEGELVPLCVQVCRPGALTYVEREEELAEMLKPGEMEIGLQALVNKHGLQSVLDSVTRMSIKS